MEFSLKNPIEIHFYALWDLNPLNKNFEEVAVQKFSSEIDSVILEITLRRLKRSIIL